MDEFVALVVILLLFIVLGSSVGFIAYSKTKKLERLLIETNNRLSDFIAGSAIPAAKQKPEDERDSEVGRPEASTPNPDSPPEAPAAEELPAFASQAAADAEKTTQSVEPKKSKRNLEETIGSMWAVWVGGIALALGAVFLVKYSIEQGLLSPAVRILLGLAFSTLLVGLGEWSRRRGEAFSFAKFDKANIPAILTAAGTMGAFATIYAAYELYQMLPPLVAFIALGIVAIATTFAALLHGPLLGALGILASFLAPMLVSTDNPSIPGLGTYILGVSASGFVVGRLRLWKWLAVLVACGMVIYGFILHFMANDVDRLAVALYVVLAWSGAAYVFFISLYQRGAIKCEKIGKTATALLSALLLLVLGSTLLYKADAFSVVLLLAAVVGPFLLAYFYSASRAHVYSAMAIVTVGYLGWSIDFSSVLNIMGPVDAEAMLTNFKVRDKLSMFTWVGVLLAVAAAAIGFWGALRSSSRAALSIGGAFLPILLFCVAYVRIEVFASSWSFSFIALVMFASFLFLSNIIFNNMLDNLTGRDEASAAYSVAAFVALALALSLVLEKAALTIALAMLVPAIAYVYYKRPLPALRPLTLFASGLWIGRVLWEPAIAADQLGTTPIFNWLTYGYGIPTLGFALATWMIGRSGRDRWLEAMEAVTLASLVATLGLVGLHAIDPSQLFTPIDTLEESALMTIVGAGVALGLLRIRRTNTSFILRHAVTVLGYLGMLMAALGLLVVFNPWVDRQVIGTGIFFNKLLFAYVVTGLLFLALGWYSRNKRHKYYSNGAIIVGALLLAAWVNLTIRHIFHPEGLHWGPTYESELYTYSIVWLVIGIALLAAGIIARTKALRIVSVGIVVLVVAKVFLIDMSKLEGILRALSFIGLGATLIGIGLVYQRVLSKPDYQSKEQKPD